MTVYLSKLTDLVSSCAELSIYNVGATRSPQWLDFTHNVETFFAYYNLKNTEEYRRFTYAISNSSSGYGSGFGGIDSPEKNILTVLFGLRQYENQVPKYFDRVFY